MERFDITRRERRKKRGEKRRNVAPLSSGKEPAVTQTSLKSPERLS